MILDFAQVVPRGTDVLRPVKSIRWNARWALTRNTARKLPAKRVLRGQSRQPHMNAYRALRGIFQRAPPASVRHAPKTHTRPIPGKPAASPCRPPTAANRCPESAVKANRVSFTRINANTARINPARVRCARSTVKDCVFSAPPAINVTLANAIQSSAHRAITREPRASMFAKRAPRGRINRRITPRRACRVAPNQSQAA
jgi:hypothetical protein